MISKSEWSVLQGYLQQHGTDYSPVSCRRVSAAVSWRCSSMALATIAGGGSMGFISLNQFHWRWESVSTATESRTVSILLRVIMVERLWEKYVPRSHIYCIVYGNNRTGRSRGFPFAAVRLVVSISQNRAPSKLDGALSYRSRNQNHRRQWLDAYVKLNCSRKTSLIQPVFHSKWDRKTVSEYCMFWIFEEAWSRYN